MKVLRMAALGAVVSLSACTTDAERRWADVEYRPDPGKVAGEDGHLAPPFQPRVMLTSTPTPPASSPPAPTPTPASAGGAVKSLKDLGDHGQAALVEETGKMIGGEKPSCAKDAKVPCAHQRLLDVLGLSLGGRGGGDAGPPAIGYVDASSFNRTIAINVLYGDHLYIGDRLDQFTLRAEPDSIQFSPDDSPHRILFTNFTFAMTQSSSSKFATVTETTGWQVSGDFNPTLAGAVKGAAEVSPQYSDSKAVAADIVEASIPLNVIVQDGALFIQKHGNVMAEITGNTLVNATLQVPSNDLYRAFVVKQLSLFTGTTPLPPDKATMAVDLTQFAPDDQNITAHVHLDYLMRHIASGAETITEGDDKVVLFNEFLDRGDLILIAQNEIVGERWVVYAKRRHQAQACIVAASLAWGRSSETFPFYFQDEQTARQFATWLRAGPADINAGQLIFKINGQPISGGGWDYGVVNRAIWTSEVKDPARSCFTPQ